MGYGANSINSIHLKWFLLVHRYICVCRKEEAIKMNVEQSFKEFECEFIGNLR